LQDLGPVPLSAQEIGAVVTDFPVYFGQRQDKWTVFTDLGSAGKGLLLEADGELSARMRPFLVNTYPFTAVPVAGSWAVGVFDDPRYISDQGRPFFENDAPSQTVARLTKRMAQFLEGRKRAGDLAGTLAEAGVLRCDTNADGAAWSVWQVDEGMLAGLGPEPLGRLHESGALALAYAQLISQVHSRTVPRLLRKPAAERKPPKRDGFLDAILNDIGDPDPGELDSLIK